MSILFGIILFCGGLVLTGVVISGCYAFAAGREINSPVWLTLSRGNGFTQRTRVPGSSPRGSNIGCPALLSDAPGIVNVRPGQTPFHRGDAETQRGQA